MGRRKDNPLLQAAKGFPGKRQSKVEKEIEAAGVAAESMPTTADDPFPIPDVFKVAPAYWSRAIKTWKEKSEVLRASGRRRPGYRDALARYCIWNQLFVSCSEQLRKDLPKGGVTFKFVKGDGHEKSQIHPNIAFMNLAESNIVRLEKEFGFTPSADQDLARVESFNAGQGRLPLGGSHPQSGGQRAAPTAEAAADPMELMNGADSLPPGTRPN